MYAERIALYRELETWRKSKVIAYVTGDRPGLETQIHSEVLGLLADHLDTIGSADRISLYLYTRGGDTLAAWSIANLIRQFCTEFEVVIPFKAHSGGTLISLGADKIVMTKQATLGPIDPSVNTPLNPGIPGAPAGAPRIPVSVEAIKGYVEFASDELKIDDPSGRIRVLEILATQVHPLVLGEVYRSRAQIRRLASRLIEKQVTDPAQVERVLAFLCSDSGSHDRTIFRQEARDVLGLAVDRPDDYGYGLIRRIYTDISAELKLGTQFLPNVLLGASQSREYSERRALLESVAGGCDYFVSEGVLSKFQVPSPAGMQDGLRDVRVFEGWRHETV
jgi:hypothetical protein